uniref:Uncharacterized protein n=1 Tax=Oryza glaberrima TaxID=4538 RepID=I1R7H2_ORYGL
MGMVEAELGEQWQQCRMSLGMGAAAMGCEGHRCRPPHRLAYTQSPSPSKLRKTTHTSFGSTLKCDGHYQLHPAVAANLHVELDPAIESTVAEWSPRRSCRVPSSEMAAVCDLDSIATTGGLMGMAFHRCSARL